MLGDIIKQDHKYVLVIDDNKVNLKIAVRNATKVFGQGVSVIVTSADGADKAVAEFKSFLESKKKPFDAVISDYDMPGKNGAAAIKEMRDIEKDNGVAADKKSIIIGFSANTEAKHLMMEAGADDCITTKQFVATEFETIINQISSKIAPSQPSSSPTLDSRSK